MEVTYITAAMQATLDCYEGIDPETIERCTACDGSGELQPDVQCKKCEGTGVKDHWNLEDKKVNPNLCNCDQADGLKTCDCTKA
jgi:DnaJ-class molecular chaperone